MPLKYILPGRRSYYRIGVWKPSVKHEGFLFPIVAKDWSFGGKKSYIWYRTMVVVAGTPSI